MAHRLLLADDSITIQKVVELTLSEEDIEVVSVGDGEAALRAAAGSVPDLLLADVFMPKLDGYELCERFKREPALKDVPVLLLVGTFEDYDEARAAQAGADDHLTKPFESAELIAKVKALLGKKAAQAAAPVEAEVVGEPVLAAEEVLEAAPVETGQPVQTAPPVQAAPDPADLWSVVDMSSTEQPLAGATEVLTEEELWRRANLVSDSGESSAPVVPEPAPGPPPEPAGTEPPVGAFVADAVPVEAVPPEDEENTDLLDLDELDAAPIMDAEEVVEAEPAVPAGAGGADGLGVRDAFGIASAGPFPEIQVDNAPVEASEADKTAMLDLDNLPSVAAEETVSAEPAPEVMDAVEAVEATEETPEAVEEAGAGDAFGPAWQAPEAVPAETAPAEPAAPTAPITVPDEVVREEVAGAVEAAVGRALDDRLKDALAGISREIIEQVVWEVVPEVAEELIAREIERIKTGG